MNASPTPSRINSPRHKASLSASTLHPAFLASTAPLLHVAFYSPVMFCSLVGTRVFDNPALCLGRFNGRVWEAGLGCWVGMRMWCVCFLTWVSFRGWVFGV
ncbi:hypothetical protein BKA65DRAFT_168974 [Rhexocercosporidium sp. MPI-PUGE-AT-0058]|nr:hypothetical protein BKA65DRAFT_168974 [Rhexocercosporidium sp. MPI-PUGE-AT-0058]